VLHAVAGPIRARLPGRATGSKLYEPATRSQHGGLDRKSSGLIVRTRASRRFLGAALIPLLLASACARPQDAGEATTVSPPPPPKEKRTASEPAPSPRAADAVDQAPAVERFCRSKFPDHYAALAVGEDQQSLIVYRRLLAGFDAVVRQQFPDLAISFQDARYSQRELTAVVQRIVADMGYWRERGVEIQGVGPAGDANSVLVTTRDPGRARRQLSQQYGVAVTVQPGGTVIPIPAVDPPKLPPATPGQRPRPEPGA
jgi:hypothetical protein